MGYSKSYTVFLGIIEVVSALLLPFRRTNALGSLLVLLIMINAAIINFSYDVPVKLFALHLVAYSIFLLYPFFNSIFQFFILKRETKLAEQKEIVFPKFIQSYKKIINAVIIVSITLLFMNFSCENMKTYGDCAPKQSLYGIYKHSLFNYDYTKITPNLILRTQFDKIIFDSKNTIIISFGEDAKYYTTKTDILNRTVNFISNSDTKETSILNYEIKSEFLKLNEIIEADSVTMIFKKVDVNSFPLINRGFHLVVESPENN